MSISKKAVFVTYLSLIMGVVVSSVYFPAGAEENSSAPTSQESQPSTPPAATSTPVVSEVTPSPQPQTEATEAQTPAAPQAEEAIENLDFVSGEVQSIDPAAKTLTVKSYGEEGTSSATIAIAINDKTDITDGENARALDSIQTGAEVDVEYHRDDKMATYIFVY